MGCGMFGMQYVQYVECFRAWDTWYEECSGRRMFVMCDAQDV